MYINYKLRCAYERLSKRCEDPNRVLQAMIRATKSTMKKLKYRSNCDLLRSLRKHNVATNEVEYGMQKMVKVASNGARNGMKRRIMRWKIDDALRVYRKSQYENARIWKRIIPVEIRREYLVTWNSFIKDYSSRMLAGEKDKVNWLVSKWKEKVKPVPDTIRGIVLEDAVLDEEFNSEPRMYGGVEVDNKEEMILELPPKFGLYRKVNERSTLISTEEAINKLRWNKVMERNKKIDVGFVQHRDGNSVVDINCLQQTVLPYNSQVKMSPATKQE